MPVEVKLRKGEAMEKALRRLKKKLDRLRKPLTAFIQKPDFQVRFFHF